MGTVRDAVIVAAGLGTRMLPTSAYVPKELLPLVDLPVMHHLILEAKHAGCDRIHIITSPAKDFTPLKENLNAMYAKGNEHLNPLDGVEVFFHTQHEQKGLGHAIMMAKEAIAGPFLVLLGDNILTSNHASLTEFQASNVSKELVQLFEKHGQPSASVYNVGTDRVSNYGIISMDEGRIVSIVEKPSKEEALPHTPYVAGMCLQRIRSNFLTIIP